MMEMLLAEVDIEQTRIAREIGLALQDLTLKERSISSQAHDPTRRDTQQELEKARQSSHPHVAPLYKQLRLLDVRRAQLDERRTQLIEAQIQAAATWKHTQVDQEQESPQDVVQE